MRGFFGYFSKRKAERRSQRVAAIPRATFAALPTQFCVTCDAVTRHDLDRRCLICDTLSTTGEDNGTAK